MSTLFWNYSFDYFLGAAHAPLAGGAAVDSFGSTKTERLPRSSAPFLYFSRRITCNSSGFAKQNLSPFKKGWILNFLCQPPFPRDRAQQSKRFGPAYPHPAEENFPFRTEFNHREAIPSLGPAGQISLREAHIHFSLARRANFTGTKKQGA